MTRSTEYQWKWADTVGQGKNTRLEEVSDLRDQVINRIVYMDTDITESQAKKHVLKEQQGDRGAKSQGAGVHP